MMLKRICLALAIAVLAPVAEAAESAAEEGHVRPVIARILQPIPHGEGKTDAVNVLAAALSARDLFFCP